MTIIEFIANDNYIVVNRDLIKLIGINPSIMLGELCSEYVYWKGLNKLDGNWFYSTVENVEERTTLNPKQQRKCLEVLKEYGVDVRNAGIPCTRHISIDEKKMTNLLGQIFQTSLVKSAELDRSNVPTKNTKEEYITKNTFTISSIPETENQIKDMDVSLTEKKKDIDNKGQLPENGNDRHYISESHALLLTNEEIDKYKKLYPNDWERYFKTADAYYMSKKKKIPTAYKTLVDWAERDIEYKKKHKTPQSSPDEHNVDIHADGYARRSPYKFESSHEAMLKSATDENGVFHPIW